MALGAVFISLPTAMVGAAYYSLIFQYGLMEAIVLYSALGLASMVTLTAAMALASID